MPKWLVSLIVLLPFNAWSSDLKEVGVFGPVSDARPFYKELIVQVKPNDAKIAEPNGEALIDRFSRSAVYDSGLSVGKFASRKLTDKESANLVSTVCVVANDRESNEWLSKNKNALKGKMPACYLAKSSGSIDAEKLNKKHPDFSFYAIDPHFLIERFSLTHYPVVVSSKGVEQ